MQNQISALVLVKPFLMPNLYYKSFRSS